MDLMEILKALFGGETLTFEQFSEKVNNAAMLNSATLQAVSMSKRTSTMMYQISLQVQTQIFLRLCQEKCASYFSNLHTLFYKLQSAVLLLLEGLLFTQNFMGCRLFTTFLTAVTYKYLLQ